jgi:hypothetical protein
MCLDFDNEIIKLQDIDNRIKNESRAFMDSKYHCELAGEGIEYTSAMTKSKYRAFPSY